MLRALHDRDTKDYQDFENCRIYLFLLKVIYWSLDQKELENND